VWPRRAGQPAAPGRPARHIERARAVPVKEKSPGAATSNRYLVLCEAISKLEKKIEALPGPGPRYSSKLLPLVPDGARCFLCLDPQPWAHGDRDEPACHESARATSAVLSPAGGARKMKPPRARPSSTTHSTAIGAQRLPGPEICRSRSCPDAGGRPKSPLVMPKVTVPVCGPFSRGDRQGPSWSRRPGGPCASSMTRRTRHPRGGEG